MPTFEDRQAPFVFLDHAKKKIYKSISPHLQALALYVLSIVVI